MTVCLVNAAYLVCREIVVADGFGMFDFFWSRKAKRYEESFYYDR
jgi:hypothetical protein